MSFYTASGIILMDDTLNRISELLEKSGMKKIEFLKKLGLSRSAWSAWMRGDAKSYKTYLPQIAEIFGVSLDWLAGNERKDGPAPENDALQPLWDIAKDFSPEECAQLIEYARLLALKHKQFNKEP